MYDGTEFLLVHPAGPDIVDAVCGMENSCDCKDAAHSDVPLREGQIYLKGVFEGSELWRIWLERRRWAPRVQVR